MPRTRLAPSPTGALHLGNARSFLVNWALARQQGWEIVLRVEDLDGPRVKAGANEEAIDVLQWLGIDWDAGPFTQRSDLAPYRAALEQLAAQGDVYPCRCTRKEIEAASLSAPHGDEHELRYPGTCRPATPTPLPPEALEQSGVAWRLRVPDGTTTFIDHVAGEHIHNIAATTGDFLVATKEGLPSYQLAVVVDDARQGIDRIVRGDDLLGSTHRQLLLQHRLGIAPPPAYYHLPLVVGADGRRLAKRHGDSRISLYRDLGVTPERIIGLLAQWCGLGPRRNLSATEFLAAFDLAKLPRQPITFTAQDDAWLRA
ncbi:tRNA glutamyl-Q(34) synthetase GluQRS [Lacipirellula limnantheis]|uniref:Glutamate--tRNA ligase n=1 Tax=Lacipirellula limnantheis TaxID=2528024 RepID=A0A517TRA0_9BACT|nr:tRNA glutamyl-Q(34) synthetase GluQRS [Lacipirellula limnantheis]QDT70902.1 Glutamate--tRNA ligase [Lacipirellula limnantheis]